MQKFAIQILLKPNAQGCFRFLLIRIQDRLVCYTRHRVNIAIYLSNSLHADRCERKYLSKK